MDILFKVIAVIIISLVLTGVIKEHSPEFAVICVIAAISLLCMLIWPLVSDIVEVIINFLGKSQTDHIIMPVLKVLGITTVMKVISDMCVDAGEKAIGHVTEIIGVVCALTAIAPLIADLIKNVGTII